MSLLPPRRAGLTKVPVDAGHQAERLAGERGRQVLVGGMLGAAAIGMRHPDGWQLQELGRKRRWAAIRRRSAALPAGVRR
jgi:hypothetical protein